MSECDGSCAARIDDLEGDVSDLRDEVDRLEAEKWDLGDEVTELESVNGELERDVLRLENANAAVLSLHRSADRDGLGPICPHCTSVADIDVEWPCTTVRAMTEAAK